MNGVLIEHLTNIGKDILMGYYNILQILYRINERGINRTSYEHLTNIVKDK